jgi:hypothetical protein
MPLTDAAARNAKPGQNPPDVFFRARARARGSRRPMGDDAVLAAMRRMGGSLGQTQEHNRKLLFAAGPDLGTRHATARLRSGMSATVPGLVKGSRRKKYPEVAFKGS